ncbi:MAG: S-layer homology domain-containing protein, partial [Gammaproteobacteria bacterium]|nr:S-layer homology domain-containing protein [Gammaproteobacteria bacterium]
TEACDPDGAGGSPGTGTLSGTTVLTFSGASLAPGESCTFSVALSVPGSALAGSHANETSIVTATVGGIAVTGNPATDDLKIDGLILTKEFTDDPVIPGDTVDLKFTIENTSAGETATAIVFQDDMDNILGGVPSITGDGVTVNDVCGAGNGTVSWSAANTRMTFSGGTLAPSAICVFTVTLNVPAAAASGTYVNSTGGGASLVFSASMSGSGGTVAFDEASDELIVASDFLSLTKEFTDDPVLPGGTVTLEFTLTNLDGAQTASDIAFTDDLDTALTGLVATVLPSAGTACNGTGTLAGTGLLTFTGGSLAAGASCSFSATLTVPPSTFPSSYVNATGGVTGTMGGLAVTGDPATDDLVVASVLPIFSKTFTDDPVSPGGSVTLEFVITNPDSVNAATGIAFTDDLAAVVPDLVAIGLPQNDVCGAGSSLSGAGLLTFTGGLLAADSSCTFSVTLEVSAFALLRTSTNNTSRLSTAELGDAVDPASDDITVAGDVILLDTDGDGITDVVEILLGLNPNDPDTDADGTPDGLEDGDGDGVSNIGELGLGFDPDNTGSTPTPTYPDVDGLHPQFLEIEILTAKGFFSGCDGTNFCPNEIIVRDAAAIPLSLAFNEAAGFGLPVGATGTVFDDILAGEFGADEVEDLQANGVSVGCAGTAGLPGFLYCPNQVVTKSSAALMLLTAESIATGGAIPVAGTSPFADVLLGDFAADAIIELFARGHTEGCDGNAITPPTLFCPHEAMTKASFAKLLVWVFGLTPP